MWGKKPALLHHTPHDYPAAFSRGIPAARTPTAPLPCPDKVHPCCFPKGPLEQDSCTPSLCHARAETTCSCRAGTGPSRQQRDNNPRLLSPAQPSHAGLGAQCKRASSLCISLHLPLPPGLSLRRGQGQWHPGSVPQAAPRVPLPCATSLAHRSPSVPTRSLVSCCSGDEGPAPSPPPPRALAQLGDSHPAAPGLVLALCPAVAMYLVSWDTAMHRRRRHRLC